MNWWGFYDSKLDPDIPLEGGYARVTGKTFAPSYVYSKSFKIQYLIYQELGREKYKELIRGLAARRSSGFTTAVIMNELNRIKPMNWREYLSGWVFQGKYHKYSMNDFGDRDQDGLIDIEERVLGTNPDLADTDKDGIADGMELSLGFTPLHPEASDRIRDKVKSIGPLIDGLSQDWEMIPEAATSQSKGNPKAAGSVDLIELTYTIHRETLYVMLKTREPLKSTGVEQYFGLVVENAGNNSPKMNHFFAFWLDRPGITWQKDDGLEIAYPSSLEAGSAEVLEMSIPLALIEARSFKIFPIIKDGPSGKKLSEWPQWVIVR